MIKSLSVTTEMKAIKNYFHVVVCRKSKSVTTEVNSTKQFFPMVLLTTLSKVVLTFEPVDEISKCDHSNKSYY